MPIRIMHVVDNMAQGGLENGVANLIERTDPNRFEHVVCGIRRLGLNADRLPKDRVRIICLNKQDSESRIHVAEIARVIRDVKPEILHSRNWAAIEGVFAGKLKRCPAIVHSEHGFDGHAEDKEPRRRIWLRRLAFELADRVLCVSNELSRTHAARTGFPAARMTVIHNGVDTERFTPDADLRSRVRRELSISDEEFCIGCVGNLTLVKDHLTILKALDQFNRSCRSWRLILIGDGPERLKIESYVHSRKDWSGRVSFLGLSDQVPELLNAFDVFVMASLTEGISNSLLEAMATGIPVIATDTGGNPEVVVDNESGLLFPVGDFRQLCNLLNSLWNDRELRTRLARAAQTRATQSFSIDTMVALYQQVYGSLVAECGPGTPRAALAGLRGEVE